MRPKNHAARAPLFAGRLPSLLGAAALVLAAVPAAAEEPEIEYGAFKQAFYDQVGGALDSRLKEANDKLAQGDLPAHERDRLEAEKAELTRLKNQVEDVKTVEALYSSVKDGMSAISDLSKEVETGFKDGSAINLGSLTVQELNNLSSLQKLSLLSKGADAGYDYYSKIKGLSEDLQAVDDTNLSPSAKRLAGSLSAMTALMSAFGDKVPLIGSFVRGYGDVGGGLLKATLALDEKLVAAEGGEMIDGVHGSRKDMLDKLHAKGIDSASRVEGMRDVFVTGDGKVLVWDGSARDWAIASDVEKGITPQELARRYRHYASQGNKNPSVEQLLKGYSRTVVITLEASATSVEPGQSVTLTPTAKLLKDERPVGGGLYFTVTEQSHTGFGSGTFSATSVKLGEKVTWTAPNNVNETYVLAADLSEETRKVAHSAGPGTVKVRTGAGTQVSVEAKPASVSAGGQVELVATVSASDGTPLPARTAGMVRFASAPAGGRFGGTRDLAERKGVAQSWTAPDKPGTYTLTATYAGAGKSGLLGSNQAGSSGSVAVEVRAAEFDLSVDGASKPASKEQPAVFTVTLENRDPEPRRFSVQATVGPKAQLAFWRRSAEGLSGAVEVPGGQSKTFKVELAPRDEKATSLNCKASAAPLGSGPAKTVEFAATAKADAKTVKVAVQASGKDGKAQVAGTSSHEATVEAGSRISLSFQAWGPRRKYCTEEVVEKNKNMKRVVLFSHGPKGCSFGTDDGTMHAEWSVADEKVAWSGPGVAAGASPGSAEFTVPAEPGTYTVTATGTVSWKYERRAPGGLTRQQETETATGSYTIVVSRPK